MRLASTRISVIVVPAEGAERGRACVTTEASRTAQADHLKRLKAIDRYPEEPFNNTDNLVAQVFLSAVRKALIKAAAMPAHQPRNLPFASLGDLFKGREAALEELRAALAGAKGVAVAGRALHGLGGIGKTRLAIEYAWAREADYSALLFVRADDAAALNAGLAALAGASVLDLPEKEAREDEAKIVAVLHWLEANPTWLLILDNVDDREAVAATANLMPRLKGGHVIVTGRAANFPPTLRTFELDALDEGAATQFLLERTAEKREAAKDDAAQAGALARELGGLALGLEQAGAHIATERIGLRPLSQALEREPRQGSRLVRRDPDRLGEDARDDLVDVSRAAFAGEPPPARPARHAGRGPDPECALRRCGSGRGGRP